MRYNILMLIAVLVLTGCDSSTDPSEEKHSVTLVSPNGNETLYFNAPNKILFDADTPVKLELYRNNVLLKTYVLEETAEGGSFTPDVFDFIEPGNDLEMIGGGYNICVVSTEDSTICDTSDASFSLSPVYFADDAEDENVLIASVPGYGHWSFENGYWYCPDSGWSLSGANFYENENFTSFSGDFIYACDVTIVDTAIFKIGGPGWAYTTGGFAQFCLYNGTDGNWVFQDTDGSSVIARANDYNESIVEAGYSGRLTAWYKNGKVSGYFNDLLLGTWTIGEKEIYGFGPGQTLIGEGLGVYYDNISFYGNLNGKSLGIETWMAP